MTPELALRDAVLTLLRADPAVIALVGEKIRDDVPSDNEPDDPPWIYMGPINTQRLEMGCGPAWSLKLRVFAESTAFDRDQAWTIARAAIRAVDGAEPPATAGFTDRLTVTQAGDVIAPNTVKTVFFDLAATLVDV
jgi:hypothetical protein